MRFTTLPGRNWFYEAWEHKTSVLAGVLAIVSLSLAHYAGFLMKVPLQIVAVAGMSLAKGVTATFLFYVFFCMVSARVLVSMLLFVELPFLAASDRLERGLLRKMDWSRQRRFVRSHSQTIKWESYFWIAIQGFLFLLLMQLFYVEFTTTWISGIGVLTSLVLILLSGLIRSGFFLQPNLKTFTRKIKSRPARAGRLASAVFVTITAALTVVAFFMGAMRANLLRNQEPYFVETKEFTGVAAVIASSEGALLLFQKQGTEFRYIYSAPEFTVSMETKAVFPLIKSKKD